MSFTIGNAKQNTLSKKVKENNYTIDDYVVDLKNDNDSHSIIANHAIGAKKILDVGCGVGYIGRAILKVQKCEIDGIDIDKKACEIASKYYNHVFIMRLGDEADKNYLAFLKEKARYDCIICGDIIEHLSDPGLILSILAKKLTPNGKLFVSIPNIAHIDVIANLIDGNFNYGETGILDNTHLRFWTESSFYDFIRNVNENYQLQLSPKLIGKTIVRHPILDTRYFEKICGEEIFTFQNIFQLTNGKTAKIPKLPPKTNYHDIIVAIDAQYELEKMKNSLSWKITSPLRKLAAFFHRH